MSIIRTVLFAMTCFVCILISNIAPFSHSILANYAIGMIYGMLIMIILYWEKL